MLVTPRGAIGFLVFVLARRPPDHKARDIPDLDDALADERADEYEADILEFAEAVEEDATNPPLTAADVTAGIPPDLPDAAGPADTSVAEVADAVEALLADAAPPAAAQGGVAAGQLPTPDEVLAAVAASEMCPDGYVTCALAPWPEKRHAGRITSWPKRLLESERSVSMRCALHSNCSWAKRRHLVCDEDLLCWLYSGRYEPDASTTRRNELASEHIRIGRAMQFPRASGGGNDAASSSTA